MYRLGDSPIALHHLGVPHIVAGAVHMGHPPLSVRQVQIAFRVVAHGHRHRGRTVFCHFPIKLRRLLQGEAL